MGHRDWKLVNRDVIYEAQTPDEISFVRDRIELTSGHQFNYVYVDCPYEVVYVVGVNAENSVLLIRQFRYLLEQDVYEIPAGSPEDHETLEEGALREFEEESGYRAKSIKKLNSFFPSSGITNQRCHIFLAHDLEKTAQGLEPTEEISVEWVELAKAVEMATSGQIENVGAALGIMLAERVLDGRS